jgi:hypothetical protein
MHLGLPFGAAFLLPELVRALTYAFFKVVHMTHSGYSLKSPP